MIIISFGVPSALSYAIEKIIEEISHEIMPGHMHIYAVFIADLKKRWDDASEEQRKKITFFSDLPSVDVVNLFTKSHAPIVISADNFSTIVRYIVADRDADFYFAVKLATHAVCMLRQSSGAPNIVFLRSDQYNHSLSSFAEYLMNHYGISCDRDQFERIVDRISVPGTINPNLGDYISYHFPKISVARMEVLESNFDSEILRVISGAYDSIVSGDNLPTITWPPQLFLETPNYRPLGGSVSLIGPARCLIHGPYLHLPAGEWTAYVEIEVGECFSENRIVVDVVSEKILAHGITKLPPQGQFSFELSFVVVDPFKPIELRFHLKEGAIEGYLVLNSVKLKPVFSPNPDRPLEADIGAQSTPSPSH